MNKKMLLASTAALLFASQAGVVHAEESAQAASSDKIQCAGTHSCAGNSDCAGAGSSGAGENKCAPYGFKLLTAEECEAKGGKEV